MEKHSKLTQRQIDLINHKNPINIGYYSIKSTIETQQNNSLI
jgi:hypothetical protein